MTWTQTKDKNTLCVPMEQKMRQPGRSWRKVGLHCQSQAQEVNKGESAGILKFDEKAEMNKHVGEVSRQRGVVAQLTVCGACGGSSVKCHKKFLEWVGSGYCREVAETCVSSRQRRMTHRENGSAVTNCAVLYLTFFSDSSGGRRPVDDARLGSVDVMIFPSLPADMAQKTSNMEIPQKSVPSGSGRGCERRQRRM